MKTLIRKVTPHTVVFFGSMSIMILELVASRIISKYFGSSLYTWTGVIGVVLAGISLGNYIGGRLADRFKPSSVIFPLLLTSSGLVFLVLVLDLVLGSIMRDAATIVTAVMVVRSLAVIVLLFFIPSTFLGMNAPIMAKYALELNLKVGTTVGSIYAVSSLGSILGTFLAGFVLIPSFDIRIIIFIVSLVIASLSFLVIGRKLVTVGVMAAIVVLFLVFQTADPDGLIGLGDDEVLYSRHSQHAHIQVKDFKTGDRVDVRTLIMNGLQHNRHDPANPDNLLYEYERIFGAVTEYYISTMRDPSSFTALTLGGGAMTFPAYMERRWDPERNSVVEIDPRVVELAFEYFDVPRDTEMNIVVADARAYVNTVRGDRTYDLIYLDAFSSFSIPYHLTTRQFAEELDQILVPDGVIMANVIDIFSIGRFLNAYHNTLAAVFPHVRVYSGPALPTTTRSTFVIVASRTPIIPDSIRDARGAPVASTISDEMLADLVERNGRLVLTDTYAPVENLIAPVFLRAIN